MACYLNYTRMKHLSIEWLDGPIIVPSANMSTCQHRYLQVGGVGIEPTYMENRLDVCQIIQNVSENILHWSENKYNNYFFNKSDQLCILYKLVDSIPLKQIIYKVLASYSIKTVKGKFTFVSPWHNGSPILCVYIYIYVITIYV